MNETGLDQVHGIKRGAPEPVLVSIVVLGYPGAEFGVGRPATNKDLLVVHGNVLHG